MSASLDFIRTIEDDEEVDVDESDSGDEVKQLGKITEKYQIKDTSQLRYFL